jgi:hypothetical protein
MNGRQPIVNVIAAGRIAANATSDPKRNLRVLLFGFALSRLNASPSSIRNSLICHSPRRSALMQRGYRGVA